MQTITLNINDNIYEKVIMILSKFRKSEIEIIKNETLFSSNKQYLENEFKDIQNKKAVFLDIDDANTLLEKSFNK